MDKKGYMSDEEFRDKVGFDNLHFIKLSTSANVGYGELGSFADQGNIDKFLKTTVGQALRESLETDIKGELGVEEFRLTDEQMDGLLYNAQLLQASHIKPADLTYRVDYVAGDVVFDGIAPNPPKVEAVVGKYDPEVNKPEIMNIDVNDIEELRQLIRVLNKEALHRVSGEHDVIIKEKIESIDAVDNETQGELIYPVSSDDAEYNSEEPDIEMTPGLPPTEEEQEMISASRRNLLQELFDDAASNLESSIEEAKADAGIQGISGWAHNIENDAPEPDEDRNVRIEALIMGQ